MKLAKNEEIALFCLFLLKQYQPNYNFAQACFYLPNEKFETFILT